MSIGIVKQFNWIDILAAVAIIRILFISYKRGLVVELFKLIGAILAVFISLHYYTRLSEKISSITRIPQEETNLVLLVFLACIILIAFKFIREGFIFLFKIEPKSIIDKWFALILGICRAGLITSLLILILFFTNITYIRNSIDSSYTGKTFLNLSPRVYVYCFEKIFGKFSPNDKLNTAIFENPELEQY